MADFRKGLLVSFAIIAMTEIITVKIKIVTVKIGFAILYKVETGGL